MANYISRRRVRDACSRVLRDPWHSKKAKTARGEALTQRSAPKTFDIPLTEPDGSAYRLVHEPEFLQETTVTVHETDAEWTGLLDSEGNDLYRIRDKIGFKVR